MVLLSIVSSFRSVVISVDDVIFLKKYYLHKFNVKGLKKESRLYLKSFLVCGTIQDVSLIDIMLG